EIMKILVACLVLVLLSASVHSEDVQARYDKFINQHIHESMKPEICNQVIGEKDIKDAKTSKCKDTNTFILSTINLVKEICDRAGPQYKDGDLTTSTKQFDIVVCKLEQKGASPPNCKYN
uniref:angiogenin-2-like n=1 Tax=Monopterus albus TaxID=43700 RepID=UPI0009B46D96